MRAASAVGYVELAVRSNFTFLEGASHPDELVAQCAVLGHRAAALADTNSLAGVVRAHVAAERIGIPLLVGCRLVLHAPAGASPNEPDATRAAWLTLLVYPTCVKSYGRLCRLLTRGKRRSEKGRCHLTPHDLLEHREGLIAIAVPGDGPLDEDRVDAIHHLRRAFPRDDFFVATAHGDGADAGAALRRARHLAQRVGAPTVAAHDVLYHDPARRPMQDVVGCIRNGCTLDAAGFRLNPSAHRALLPPEEVARRFADDPQAVRRTVRIANRVQRFSLSQIRYRYPGEVVPPGRTAMQHLAQLTWANAGPRLGHAVPVAGWPTERTAFPPACLVGPFPPPEVLTPHVEAHFLATLTHELNLIAELGYAHYFLTVEDLVGYARGRGILCQGRGAAANSVVCYCLGVTDADPRRINTLFERFVSRERKEPPDIDVDFEHDRREEVIQYLYTKYGRDRAALCANVITYRGRSAVREVGKTLGLSLDVVDRLAKGIDWWHGGPIGPDQLAELKLDPRKPAIAHLVRLSTEIQGFPRHLGQHSGGFVLTEDPLCDLVPIENASMADRTTISWDKDDIDAVGMLKVDVLAIGLLSVLSKVFALLGGQERASEEAKKRRSEGVSRTQEQNHGRASARVTESPQPDRLAERHGTLPSDLPMHAGDAKRGAVRVDRPDAAGFGVGSLKYCGRFWAGGTEGVSPAPADCAGFSERACDSARAGNVDGHDPKRSDDDPFDRRNRPRPAGLYSQRQAELEKDAISLCLTSSLPRFSASSLPPPGSLRDILRLPDDPATYDMICAADTVGVFQIESRAQMSMLPRLRPRTFYDLVIEVAIVRPGPIQGDMVHPYLRRRRGEEPVEYPDEKVEWILGKTLGVPLFQEQAMQLAIHCAGFTPDEADKLRRAVTGFRHHGLITAFGEQITGGMIERGYTKEFAERVFSQIQGFSHYGFPESHAASFAILTYASSYIKCHYPAAFCCALLNSQPMGFYAPAQLIQDAQRHGVEVRGVDVLRSGWACSLEAETSEEAKKRGSGEASEEAEKRRSEEVSRGREDASERGLLTSSLPNFPASSLEPRSGCVRLGLNRVRGLREEDGRKIEAATSSGVRFASIESLWRAAGCSAAAMRRLAAADAFSSMGLDRQSATWHARKLRDDDAPLFRQAMERPSRPDTPLPLPELPELRHVVADHTATGVSLRPHVMSFLRADLQRAGVATAESLADGQAWPSGRRVAVAGICLVRQRPGTAKSLTFMTLEDETGFANLVVWPDVFEAHRRVARHATAMLVRGRIDRAESVVHVRAASFETLDHRLADLKSVSRNFH
ncbi:error-prone DNA polymerase [Phycisphaera mikurensis NBRC 102666]|uniref:Error-prone DNA polymerase n=2 Tax=Phycisphaera TaxID=666508 RepID=I0IG42_PHYMF|nr:error-prone DNA polymerase [Phycisphaera mikurensis NBRC 102666]